MTGAHVYICFQVPKLKTPQPGSFLSIYLPIVYKKIASMRKAFTSDHGGRVLYKFVLYKSDSGKNFLEHKVAQIQLSNLH